MKYLVTKEDLDQMFMNLGNVLTRNAWEMLNAELGKILIPVADITDPVPLDEGHESPPIIEK